MPRKRIKETEYSPVFDVAKEVNKIFELYAEMELMRKKYIESIARLENISNETKEKVNKSILSEINKIGNKFFSELSEKINKISDYVLSRNSSEIAKFIQELKTQAEDAESVFDHIKTIQKGDKPIAGIDFPFPKNGEDGKVDEEKLIKEILKKLLDKDEVKRIKNIENTVRNLGSKIMLGGKSGGGQGSHKQKTLSGAINGINTVFTFTGDPLAEFSERVFLNYIEQNPFTDYTISGNTVTYTTAPDASLSGLPHIIRGM